MTTLSFRLDFTRKIALGTASSARLPRVHEIQPRDPRAGAFRAPDRHEPLTVEIRTRDTRSPRAPSLSSVRRRPWPQPPDSALPSAAPYRRDSASVAKDRRSAARFPALGQVPCGRTDRRLLGAALRTSRFRRAGASQCVPLNRCAIRAGSGSETTPRTARWSRAASRTARMVKRVGRAVEDDPSRSSAIQSRAPDINWANRAPGSFAALRAAHGTGAVHAGTQRAHVEESAPYPSVCCEPACHAGGDTGRSPCPRVERGAPFSRTRPPICAAATGTGTRRPRAGRSADMAPHRRSIMSHLNGVRTHAQRHEPCLDEPRPIGFQVCRCRMARLGTPPPAPICPRGRSRLRRLAPIDGAALIPLPCRAEIFYRCTRAQQPSLIFTRWPWRVRKQCAPPARASISSSPVAFALTREGRRSRIHCTELSE